MKIRTMPAKSVFLGVLALSTFVPSALGQVTNAISSGTPISLDQLPRTKSEFWAWGISLVTPVITAFIYRSIPKIPKVLVPLLTPFIGIGLGLILNWLQKTNMSWVDMAAAGSIAVFIREVTSQASKVVVTNSLLPFVSAPVEPKLPPLASVALSAPAGPQLPPLVP